MKPYHAFGRVPPSVPASQPVRYWHTALMVSVLAFLFTYALLLLIVHVALGHGAPGSTLAVGTNVPLWLLTMGGATHGAVIREAVASASHPVLYAAGLLSSCLLSAIASLYVGHRTSQPRTSQYHVRGMELQRGDQAKAEAKRITAREDIAAGTVTVRLSDDLVLSKRTLSRHVLVSGSVGSGKTVILHRFIDTFVHDRKAKALIYDVKGDFTACYPSCAIVGAEDERGRSIPLGKVIRTKKHAAIFMQSIIPDTEGSSGSKFFDTTARLVGVGAIMTLINRDASKWGASELAEMMNKQAPELAALFKIHYQKAAQALGDPNAKTATDIMATVASYTRIFDELDLAWGPYHYGEDLEIRRDEHGSPVRRKEWNPMEWIRDDYDDKRCIILQGGGDKQITRGFISAIINLITPEIVSPALDDCEEGRCLAFVLDEMPTIGKINDFEQLAVAGRSKGVVMVMAYQDIAQMKALYGADMTATIESTVYTRIVCQQQMGATRDHIAKAFSSRIIASVSHADGRVHEEGKAVVYPDELTTELGFRKGKEFGPEGWGIRYLASIGGNNPLILTCPGQTRKKRRPGRVAGAWTKAQWNEQGRVKAVLEQHEREQVNTEARREWSRDQTLYQHAARTMLGMTEEEAEANIESMRPDPFQKIIVPPLGGLDREEY